jgi:hypothetical protein
VSFKSRTFEIESFSCVPDHQPRLEKSAFMYRRLTVAFGTLCREQDSPLTMTWEDEESQENLANSEELRTLFSQLRCAFRQFCTPFQIMLQGSLLRRSRSRELDKPVR